MSQLNCLSIIFATLIFPLTGHAACLVHVPVKEFLHSSGFTIRFDFTSILEKKGYIEVDDPSRADQILLLEGNEIEGSIHQAEGRLVMGGHEVSRKRYCFTQFCGVSDYAQAFRKAYRALDRELPVCGNGSSSSEEVSHFDLTTLPSTGLK